MERRGLRWTRPQARRKGAQGAWPCPILMSGGSWAEVSPSATWRLVLGLRICAGAAVPVLGWWFRWEQYQAVSGKWPLLLCFDR